MLRILFCLLVAVLPVGVGASLAADSDVSVRVVTEEFPPYNFTRNGMLTGISTEAVRAMFDHLGERFQPVLLPWARAQDEAMWEENVAIYSMMRTAEREDEYQWVGPIAPSKVYVFCLAERKDIVIRSIEDIRNYRVGTQLMDARETYLLARGFRRGVDFQSVPDQLTNVRKLLAGRVDVIMLPELAALHYLEDLGESSQVLRKVYHMAEMGSDGYYLAFGLKTARHVVDRFQEALEHIKMTGKLTQIFFKYAR